MKLAVLFAGQGAQKPGMCKSLYDRIPAARQIFDEAESVSPGIRDLCFEGPAEKLNETVHTQPCVYTADCACWAAFATLGIRPQVGAGFSLGEYAALQAAGVFSFSTGLKIVSARARYMHEAATKTPGSMAAVLGMEAKEVEEMVHLIRGQGVLQAVNYNCPGQTVVAGDVPEIDNLIEYAKEHKVRVRPLPVSGAFHSKRMAEAAERTGAEIEGTVFAEPEFVLYANRTGAPYVPDAMKRTLTEQTASPVLFEDILRDILKEGIDTFVELGPGKTLAGFVKKIDKSVRVHSLNDYESFAQVKDALTEET